MLAHMPIDDETFTKFLLFISEIQYSFLKTLESLTPSNLKLTISKSN